jgi:hypothetical protein
MTVRKTIQDSAYVAVGVAVLGAQRVQVRRREMTGKLQTMGTEAKSRIEPMMGLVSEPAKAAGESAKARISELPNKAAEVTSQIPAVATEFTSQLAELPNMMIGATEHFSSAQERVSAIITRAMAEGKARLNASDAPAVVATAASVASSAATTAAATAASTAATAAKTAASAAKSAATKATPYTNTNNATTDVTNN